MGENTSISWANHTFNCWWGCTRIEGSPACGPARGEDGPNCYAEDWAKRCGYSETGSKFPIWGAHSYRRYFGDAHWNEPLKWNAKAAAAGEIHRAFCMSMGDWAEGRPDQAPHLLRLWELVRATQNISWLMLTKRPQLIAKLCPFSAPENNTRENARESGIWSEPGGRIWQGVTAENQHWLDIRWRILKQVPARIYWLSIEPMFGRIFLPASYLELGRRGWVILGGPSGVSADRYPMDWAAIRRLRDQCHEAGVAFHMKQASGRSKAELEAIPPDCMIRQYPEVAA